jgi:hypothetical protein
LLGHPSSTFAEHRLTPNPEFEKVVDEYAVIQELSITVTLKMGEPYEE